jgi:DNA-binding IclR family transcriptional regulator
MESDTQDEQRVTGAEPPAALNQGIERTAAILRALGKMQEAGARLTDVSAETGLSKSTAHRLLAALVQIGFVEQDTSTGRFYLSYEMFTLGSAAANRNGIVQLAHDAMQRLIERTEDSVTLHARSGPNDSICLARLEGHFPVKVMTMSVGDRRPLGIGSGPLAILAFLSDSEIESIIAANMSRYAEYPSYSGPRLYEMVEATRRQGYAINQGGIVPEIYGVAVPIMSRDAKPIAAISIATISARMQAPRLTTIISWLLAEARRTEQQVLKITAGLNESSMHRLGVA